MVRPEFKPFSFIVQGADHFDVISDGNRMIDFSGSAMTTGYNFIRAEWLEPVISRLVFNNPYTIELTDRLTEISGFQNVAFSTSGTEACDAALTRFGRPIFALEGAYHGLTYLTKLVSNGTGYDQNNNIIHLKCPTSKVSMEDAIDYNDTLLRTVSFDRPGGTMIMELIQSDGGVNVLSEEFIKYLFDLAEKYELRTIIDEVYTGYGRSGEMFLFKKYGIQPDMVCLGKGMAAGLPLGAVLYNDAWDLPYNQVLSMQAANMFVSRVALEVIDALNEDRLEFVRRNGADIIKRLSEIRNSRVSAVHGRGFMIGVDFADERGNADGNYALKIRDELARNNVICSLTGEYNNVLKITPPVLIDQRTLEDAIDRIVDVINKN